MSKYLKTELDGYRMQLINCNLQLSTLMQIQRDIEDRKQTLLRQVDRILQSPDYVEEEEGEGDEEEEEE